MRVHRKSNVSKNDHNVWNEHSWINIAHDDDDLSLINGNTFNLIYCSPVWNSTRVAQMRSRFFLTSDFGPEYSAEKYFEKGVEQFTK